MLIGTVCFPINCTQMGCRNGVSLGFNSALLGCSSTQVEPIEKIRNRSIT